MYYLTEWLMECNYFTIISFIFDVKFNQNFKFEMKICQFRGLGNKFWNYKFFKLKKCM